MTNTSLIGGAVLQLWDRVRRGPGVNYRLETCHAYSRFLREIGVDPAMSLGPPPGARQEPVRVAVQ